MRWIEALKVWNRTKKDIDPSHCWCTPRKGTPEHKDVMNIIANARPATVAARNEARRVRALEQLRAVEAAAKARMDVAMAARAAAAPPKAPSVKERVEAIEERVAPKPMKVRRKAVPKETVIVEAPTKERVVVEEERVAPKPVKARKTVAVREAPKKVEKALIDKFRKNLLKGATKYSFENAGIVYTKPLTDERIERSIAGTQIEIDLITKFNETGELGTGGVDVLRNFIRAEGKYEYDPSKTLVKDDTVIDESGKHPSYNTIIHKFMMNKFSKGFKFKREIGKDVHISKELKSYAKNFMM